MKDEERAKENVGEFMFAKTKKERGAALRVEALAVFKREPVHYRSLCKYSE